MKTEYWIRDPVSPKNPRVEYRRRLAVARMRIGPFPVQIICETERDAKAFRNWYLNHAKVAGVMTRVDGYAVVFDKRMDK